MKMAMKKKKPIKEEDNSPMIIKDSQGNVTARYDGEMLQTIKSTVAKNSTDEELYMFLSLAGQYGLDPFRKEIWFIKYGNKEPQIFTSRDGMVKIAKQEPDFKQINSFAVYEADDFELEQQMTPNGLEITNFRHKFNAKDRGEVIGAYSVIEYHTKKPLIVYVDYNEYKQGGSSTWKKNASAMIRKVAEKEVCRLSAGISGLHIPEEMPKGFGVDDTEDDFKKANSNRIKMVQSDDTTDEVVEDEEDVEIIDVEIDEMLK